MQTVTFPMKIARFSSLWNSRGAHSKCSGSGYKSTNHKDYPTDLVGSDTGKDWFYAPCDLICLKVYGKASHGLWFRSVDKVKMPVGEGYFYMMAEHESVAGFKVGRKYAKGTRLFLEGRAGNATGNHIHLSCGWAKDKDDVSFGSGWVQNNHGAWVLHIKGVTNIKIEKAMYIDPVFTDIKDKRIKFKTAPEKYEPGKKYKLKSTMKIRKGAGTNYKQVGTFTKGKTIIPIAISKKSNGSRWGKIKDGMWVCLMSSTGKEYAS